MPIHSSRPDFPSPTILMWDALEALRELLRDGRPTELDSVARKIMQMRKYPEYYISTLPSSGMLQSEMHQRCSSALRLLSVAGVIKAAGHSWALTSKAENLTVDDMPKVKRQAFGIIARDNAKKYESMEIDDVINHLYKKFSHRIKKRIRENVPRADESDVEDLCQTVFLSTFKGLSGKNSSITNPQGLLDTVTLNHIRCARRDLRRRRISHAEAYLPEPAPFEQRINSDLYFERLVTHTSVPESSRGPLQLFYAGGLSCEEIAEALGSNEDTVRVQLHRGRKKIAEYLEEQSSFPKAGPQR